MNRWLRLGLQLLGVLLFVAILLWAGRDSWQQIVNARLQPLLLAFGLHGIATVASALRLQQIAQALVPEKRLASWQRFYYLNTAVRAMGLVIPRSVSGVGGKAVGLAAYGISARRAVWIVLVDNLLDVVMLGLVLVPAVFFLRQMWTTAVFIAVTMLLLGALAAVGVWLVAPQRVRLLRRQLRRVPFFARRLPGATSGSPPLLPTAQPLLLAIGLSLLLHSVLVSSFYLMGQAVRLPATPSTILASYPFVQLSLIIALAPGGLGLFELGWVGLLQLGGITAVAAVTFAVAQRAFTTIFVLLWAGISLLVRWTDKE